MECMREQMAGFWRKLSRLIDSGIPLLSTLEVIAGETEDERLRGILQGVRDDLMSGKRFSECLERYPGRFPPSTLKLVVMGEETGSLERAARQIAEGLAEGTFRIGDDPEEGTDRPARQMMGLHGEDNVSAELVVNIIEEAFTGRSSDVHFERTRNGLRVRCRVDGVLHERPNAVPANMADAVTTRIKIMANMDVAGKRLPQDGRIRMTLRGRDLDLRASLIPYATGESITLRIFDKTDKLMGMDEMALSEDNLTKLNRWIRRPNGAVIVTAPTGCGKTTLLYSVLQALNSPELKITTVEDPVEHLIDGLNQQQVSPHVGLTFARALRCHLRQDTDIVMVGEIRDLETAQIVVQACLTGHLALTTLHTHDAPEAVRRMLDIGVAPFLVNSALTGVVAQRLVRTICENCKEEYTPEDWVKQTTAGHADIRFFRGRGCATCQNMGFRGRTAIHELLDMDNEMRSLVARDADGESLRRQALASGMVSMRDDGIAKVARGITTIEEVFRVIG